MGLGFYTWIMHLGDMNRSSTYLASHGLSKGLGLRRRQHGRNRQRKRAND